MKSRTACSSHMQTACSSHMHYIFSKEGRKPDNKLFPRALTIVAMGGFCYGRWLMLTQARDDEAFSTSRHRISDWESILKYDEILDSSGSELESTDGEQIHAVMENGRITRGLTPQDLKNHHRKDFEEDRSSSTTADDSRLSLRDKKQFGYGATTKNGDSASASTASDDVGVETSPGGGKQGIAPNGKGVPAAAPRSKRRGKL